MHSTEQFFLKWRVDNRTDTCEQGRAKTRISPLRCGTTGIFQVSVQVQIQGLSSYSDRRVVTQKQEERALWRERSSALMSQENNGSQSTETVYAAALHSKHSWPSWERDWETKEASYTGGNVACITGRKPVKDRDGNQAFLSFPISQSKICRPVALVSYINLLKYRISGHTPDLLNQNLHFNKIPRGYTHTSKSEESPRASV